MKLVSVLALAAVFWVEYFRFRNPFARTYAAVSFGLCLTSVLPKCCALVFCGFWQFYGLKLFEQTVISNSSVLFCWQWMGVCL